MPAGLPILILCLLLLFPQFSVKGASDGLLLWFQVVLPALAPFMICTQLIAAAGGSRLLMKPFSPVFRGIFGLSEEGSYVLLCGLLCGYPLGAKLCADFLQSGKITRAEANYLFSICSHPSPMFLIGYVQPMLGGFVPPLALIFCIYLPILPIAALSRKFYNFRKPDKVTDRGQGKPQTAVCWTLEDILLSSSEAMVLIGNYIMLFSILAEWIRHLSLLPPQIQALLSGMAEITTGCRSICQIFPKRAAAIPIIGAVGFGGLSGVFQTKGVIKNVGLSIRHYAVWKCLHSMLSVLFVILYMSIKLLK